MEDANKTEAKYVKKGKELQRKSRREDIRQRRKIKQAHRRREALGERMMSLVEGGKTSKYSNAGGDVTDSDDEDGNEHDEVALEQKLATIKAKNARDKEEHRAEVEAIRRQCEQLKLRLSVARLVMEGDDHLHDYMALLERVHPRGRTAGRRDAGAEGDGGRCAARRGAEDVPSPPPARITRARAKLLKATHLSLILNQRLAVSKAFTDATIDSLEIELSERDNDRQKMEVKCLNDLMLIDSRMKEVVREGRDKVAELEAEARGLEEAIANFTAEKSVTSVNTMFECDNAALESRRLTPEESTLVDDESSSGRSVEEEEEEEEDEDEDEDEDGQDETGPTTNATSPNLVNGIQDKSEIQRPETGEAVLALDESSDEMSIDDEDDQEEQVDIQRISSNMSIDDGYGEAQLESDAESESDDESHVESLQSEKIRTDVSSLQTSRQNLCESAESLPLSAIDVDNEDGDCSKGSDKKYVEDSVSFDEGTQQGDDSHRNSDFSLSKGAESETMELVSTENTREKQESTTQRRPSLECPSNQSAELTRPTTAAKLLCGGEKSVNKGDNDKNEEMVTVEKLGRELVCALADYKTSGGLSSSNRIKQLNYMNEIVGKIGKVHWGIEPNSQSSGKSRVKSWSHKKMRGNLSDKERQKKKRSRRKKKSRPHHGRESRKVKAEGPDDIVERFGKSLVW